MSKRPAILTAVTLNVCCPYCLEPQPNPDDGGDGWTAEEVRQVKAGTHVCVSCEESFQILLQSRANISWGGDL